MQRKDIFNQESLLNAIDLLLPQAEHYKEILKIHREQLKLQKDIIDLGCGTGNLTIQYLSDGKNVTAVDIAQKSLEILKRKAKNLKIYRGDITNLYFIEDDTYDGASAMIVSHLVKDYHKHIEEVYRILKPKGKFVITARTAQGNPEIIVDIVRESVQYDENFLILRDQLLRTATERSPSLYSTKDAIKTLEEKGFRNIKEFDNKSREVMYTLTAEKL